MSDSVSVNRHTDARIRDLLRETERKLQRQNQVVVDLARRPSVQQGHFNEALREITEAAAETLDVDRVSIWLYDEKRTVIRCCEQFARKTREHSSGAEVEISTNPGYFEELERSRAVAVHDVARDARTAALTDETVRSSGMRSTIDAPIRRMGRVTGLVRHTNVGKNRQWTIEDENFAASIADLVAIVSDAAEQHVAEESLRRRLEFEQLVSRISTRFVEVGPADLEKVSATALHDVAVFARADRGFVVAVDEAGSGSMMSEWCADGVDSARESVSGLMLAAYPWINGVLNRRRSIRIDSVDDLAGEAASERDLLRRLAVHKLLAVSMYVGRKFIGILGVSAGDSQPWPDDALDLLRLLGNSFGGTLNRVRTEEALRDSEQRYRALFERNLAGVYRNTIDGRMLDCNDALARMLGYDSREEVLTHNAGESYAHPADREAFIDRVLRERSVTAAETALRRRDGRQLWILESVHLVEGTTDLIEGTAIDITSHKLAETALLESESRYRTLIERMHEGMAQLDNDSVFQFVNDRFCRMVGYSREELLGRRAGELLLTSESDRDLLSLKAAQRQDGISDQYQIRMQRKDGVEIWVEISGAPVCDAGGKVIGSVGIHNDVTERRATAEALRESESRYRLMAENSTDLISRLSARGTILYASPAMQSLLLIDPAEVTGHSIFDLVEPIDHEVVRLATRTLARRGAITFSYRVKRRDGKEIWFETTCRGIKDPVTRKLTEIVTVSRDVSERKRVEEHVEFQAYHDELTSLPNRTLFRDRLTIALAQARRMRCHLAVMFIDLDSFKVVNDTLGHSLGDELLKSLAGRLGSIIRAEDTIARMGGDEFTVVASNLNSIDDASLVAQKLLDTIAQPIQVEGNELFVTSSIGIAIYPEDGETVEALLKNADNAMYRAKETGRNSYKLCTPAMNRRALERLSLENALRRAIDREEFVLHYQPLVRIDGARVVGMEALLRWNRPDHGLIEPADFIAIAEETRMIVPLGEWVLRQACIRAKKWQSEKYAQVRVSVNLSPRQFQHNDLPRMVLSALDASGLDPSLLELEITEGTAMMNNERTVMTMRHLRDLGISLAIDDFGTGQSSLNYLHNFPIDGVKIDQTFVRGIETRASDRAIISAVVAMARGLDLRVTAEGVETEPQLEFLRGCGCDEAQGFLFSAPVASHAL